MNADTAIRITRIGSGRRGWTAALVAFLGFVLAGASYAQTANSLESVSVSRASSGRVVVRFQLKAPPANPFQAAQRSSPHFVRSGKSKTPQ